MHEFSRLCASGMDGLTESGVCIEQGDACVGVRRLGMEGLSLEAGWRGSVLMLVVVGAAGLGCKRYLN